MSQTAADRHNLLELLRSRSVRRGDFVLASGKRSDFYIDARITTMSGRGQELIGRVALGALDDYRIAVDLVGGLTMGADPVAYAIAHSAALGGRPINAFSVRKQPKDHGTGRRVEGPFEPDQNVVVVEDVITSGGSALNAIEAIREAGGNIVGVLALVDRQEGGRERIEATGLPVIALFNRTELLGNG